jgi:Protein of unknown function/Domain of unknown function (DUF1835)
VTTSAFRAPAIRFQPNEALVAPTESRLHIVFGTSAQETLTEALRLGGSCEPVVAFPDDLSIGPINGEGGEARVAWMVREFGPSFASLGNLPVELEAFWRALRSTEAVPVIWFTRRSAREYSGFLELAWTLGERPYQIVDFTGVDFVKRLHEGPGKLLIYLGLDEMRPLEAAGFLSSTQVLSSPQRERYRQIWSRLRQENAALRVLTDDGLASQPASFFDDALLEATPASWQKIAKTIGDVLGLSWDDNVFQISPMVLASRIRTLVTPGALECRGDVDDIHTGEIRRPDASPMTATVS